MKFLTTDAWLLHNVQSNEQWERAKGQHSFFDVLLPEQ